VVEEISDNDDDTCRLSHGHKKNENMDLDQQGYVIQYREIHCNNNNLMIITGWMVEEILHNGVHACVFF
jgi:hypothetical protein